MAVRRCVDKTKALGRRILPPESSLERERQSLEFQATQRSMAQFDEKVNKLYLKTTHYPRLWLIYEFVRRGVASGRRAALSSASVILDLSSHRRSNPSMRRNRTW